MTQTTVRETLYVTHAQGRVHVTACPHLRLNSTVTVATPEQVEANGLCSRCELEIHGLGRTRVGSLEASLKEFGHDDAEALRLITEALSSVTYDDVWFPVSGSYIALGEGGQGVAWIGQEFIHTEAGGRIALPWITAATRASIQREDIRGDLCATHFVEKSLSGECDVCE